jgi:hypothetical protein
MQAIVLPATQGRINPTEIIIKDRLRAQSDRDRDRTWADRQRRRQRVKGFPQGIRTVDRATHFVPIILSLLSG